MSTAIKIVADKENKTMQWKEEIRTGRNQEAAPAKRIQSMTSMAIPFLPKFGGTWGPSFSSKP